jgi:hypothetical protein
MNIEPETTLNELARRTATRINKMIADNPGEFLRKGIKKSYLCKYVRQLHNEGREIKQEWLDYCGIK